jgi:hypothetical protein
MKILCARWWEVEGGRWRGGPVKLCSIDAKIPVYIRRAMTSHTCNLAPMASGNWQNVSKVQPSWPRSRFLLGSCSGRGSTTYFQ